MASPRRVVITGLGAVSALGNSAEAFWSAISAGRSGIGPFELPAGEKVNFSNAAPMRNFDPLSFLDEREVQQHDRVTLLALAAAHEAVRDAGIEWTPSLQDRTGVVMGTSIGGAHSHDNALRTLYAEGKNRLHPLTIPRIMPNAGASHISMTFGARGPVMAVSTACASASHAIGQAFWLVRNGQCELALAGGSETPLCYGFLKAWEAIRVVAPDTCRPFSRDRRGMILGEGAAVLVLEPLEAAVARGATIYAELAGFGMSADAGHLTNPDPAGARRAMELALADAGLHPTEIDYINAHGTGTRANDSMEATAIHALFGAHAGRLAVSSTKSMHGHALGATAGLEAVATALALKNELLPPTANFTEADPECELDVVPNAARPQALGGALSNSFAFGGLNAVLAFRRYG